MKVITESPYVDMLILVVNATFEFCDLCGYMLPCKLCGLFELLPVMNGHPSPLTILSSRERKHDDVIHISPVSLWGRPVVEFAGHLCLDVHQHGGVDQVNQQTSPSLTCQCWEIVWGSSVVALENGRGRTRENNTSTKRHANI